METYNDVYFIDAILNDERFGGKKFTTEDLEKLQESKEMWKEIFRPIAKYFFVYDSVDVVIDIFFNDYEAIKEKALDKSGEIMAVFGECVKKIDEKIEKK